MGKKDSHIIHFGIHLTRFAWYAREKKFPGVLYVHVVEAVAQYLQEKSGYPRASVRKWLVDGNVAGPHPLTKNVFAILIKEWAGKVPGLLTKEDIYNFARLGKDEYVSTLNDDDMRKVLDSLQPGPLSPYWQNQFDYLVAIAPPLPQDWLARPDIEKDVLAKADFCRQSRRPLLIYGDPGAGKSTLMKWLYWHKYAEKEFGFERVWIRGEMGKSTHDWLGLLFLYFVHVDAIEDMATALARLKSAWGQSRWLIALDDCDNIDFMRLVAESLPPGSLLVASVGISADAHKRFPLNCSLEVTGAPEIFAIDLYRWLLEPVPSQAREWVQRVNAVVKGNVLAMKLAFGLDVMEGAPQDDITRVLEIASPEGQIPALLGLFSERVDVTLAARLRLVGILPSLQKCDLAAFASLWETEDKLAGGTLLGLTRRGLLDSVEDGWQVQESIRAFFAEGWGESLTAEQDAWLERYFVRSNRALWLDKQLRSMPYRWFWQNTDEQERLWMLLSAQGKWGKEPQLTQVDTIASGLRSFKRESGLQWTVFSENSVLFSSLDFVSGYALRRRMNTRRQVFNRLMWNAIVSVLFVQLASILATLLGVPVPAWVRNLTLFLALLFFLGRAVVGMFTLTTRIDTLYNHLWDKTVPTQLGDALPG